MGAKLIDSLKTKISLNLSKRSQIHRCVSLKSRIFEYLETRRTVIRAQEVSTPVYFVGSWVHSTSLLGMREKRKKTEQVIRPLPGQYVFREFTDQQVSIRV